MTNTLLRISCIAAALTCGCASNPTRSSVVVPLQIPEPPPKPPILPVPAPEAPPERPAAPVPAVRPAPAQPSGGPSAAGSAPAPVPPATSSAAVGPPESVAVAAPAPELRPAGSAASALTGTQLRESLDRTKRKLDAIDRRRLNAGKRADYDSARRFLSQADSAAKANNLMLAQSSVEKAEALADGLR